MVCLVKYNTKMMFVEVNGLHDFKFSTFDIYAEEIYVTFPRYRLLQYCTKWRTIDLWQCTHVRVFVPKFYKCRRHKLKHTRNFLVPGEEMNLRASITNCVVEQLISRAVHPQCSEADWIWFDEDTSPAKRMMK